jgi:hypothetical protein
MGEYVFVAYGAVGGLNPLTGVGRVIGVKECAGLTWVLVEPVFAENSIPLEKWVLFASTQYTWELAA